MTPRVTVIIPLYNKAAYVLRALDSVSAQTFADFEAIVIDDGSTDESARIVAAYGDERFRLLRQANAGPGAARNRGIAEAVGEFTAFLDADDEWLPEYLGESVRLLMQYDDVATITARYIEHPRNTSLEMIWRARGVSEGVHRLTEETSPHVVVSMLAYMSPCSTIARTRTLRRWGGFYDRDKCLYGEDAFLWLKVLLNEAVAFNLSPLVRLHRDASGLSKNLKGARPVEPFLIAPDEIHAACPAHLRHLLAQVLASRAFKTACVLGYWGHWREARALTRQFAITGSWRLRKYMAAQVCSTPLGAGLGRAWRRLLALGS